MKALTARVTRGLNLEAKVPVCDNSGAKIIKIFSVNGLKTRKGKVPQAGIGDIVNASIVKGKPGMKSQVVQAIIVRQRREYRRLTGERIKFEDNAAVVLKDDKGNPKGTIIKGAIAKEVTERWPGIAKIASIVV